MKEERIFFQGLNSLRAIGALAVCIGHIELLRKMFGLRNYTSIPFFKNDGGHLGVILFFVLSGFLITYLLLEENRRIGTIAIKKFYVRRILRIWPLYYWALIIAFFIMPIAFAEYPGRDLNRFVPKLLLDMLFVPNVSLIALGGISGASHLWSIGVEEQFYLMWPGIIKRFYKYALYALIVIFIVITLLPNA
ncbi:MAG: acyltransferase, partial [Bacteroidota bacterium]